MSLQTRASLDSDPPSPAVASPRAGPAWLDRPPRRRPHARNPVFEAADLAVEGLVIAEHGRIVALNSSLQQLLGRQQQEYLGRSIDTVLPGWTASMTPIGQERGCVLSLVTGAAPVCLVAQNATLGGRSYLVIAVRDQRGRGDAEAAPSGFADIDPVTGLANRRWFRTVLTEWCAEDPANERRFALLALDLSHFKTVNDAWGRDAGDGVLARVAGRLRALARDGDVIARVGGDEFALLLAGADAADRARTVAERMVDAVCNPFIIGGVVYDLGANVGVALAPQDGAAPDTLIRNADLALHRAKEDGSGQYRMFQTEMDNRMQERRSLELALRRAAAREEFELHYQVQVEAGTGEYEGAEALIRWRDPQRGQVSPAQFIPLAEETGLITGIGEWVLRTACLEALNWPAHLRVSVNVSAVQLRDAGFGAMVVRLLQETGLPAPRLELEITESVLVQDEGHTLTTLERLKTLGVHIALDDFGTGYSSLSYLRRFPFGKIKIDQSFIRRTPEDSESAAIVAAVVALASGLGMTTIAEGVETEAQHRFVAAQGCQQIQGYLFGRPVPAHALPPSFQPGGTMIIQRLLYRSQSVLTGAEADIRRQVDAIVGISRSRNEAVGVTGALLFTGGVFIQALEGERDPVEAAFERLCRDPRHRRVMLLEYAEAQGRIFPQWSMAALHGGRETQAMYPAADEAVRTGRDAASARAAVAHMLALLRSDMPSPGP